MGGHGRAGHACQGLQESALGRHGGLQDRRWAWASRREGEAEKCHEEGKGGDARQPVATCLQPQPVQAANPAAQPQKTPL